MTIIIDFTTWFFLDFCSFWCQTTSEQVKSDDQYKLLYAISNNIEVYEEPVERTKKIPHYAVKFETGEKKRNVHESLYWRAAKTETELGRLNCI